MMGQDCPMVINMNSGAGESWVQILVESITSCVTLGKLLKPTVPQFSQLYKNSVYVKVVKIK